MARGGTEDKGGQDKEKRRGEKEVGGRKRRRGSGRDKGKDEQRKR